MSPIRSTAPIVPMSPIRSTAPIVPMSPIRSDSSEIPIMSNKMPIMSSQLREYSLYYAYLCTEYPFRHFRFDGISKNLYINQITKTE